MKRTLLALFLTLALIAPACGDGGTQEVAYDDRNCYGYTDEDEASSRDDGIVLVAARSSGGGFSSGSRAPAARPAAPPRSSTSGTTKTTTRAPAARPVTPPKAGTKPPTTALPPKAAIPTRPVGLPSSVRSRYREPSGWDAPWVFYPIGYYPPHVNHVYYDDHCRTDEEWDD